MSTHSLEVTFYGSGNAQVDVPVSAATRCSVIVKELAFFCAVSATVAVLDQQSVASAFTATGAGALTATARQNYTHELEVYLAGSAKVPTLKPITLRSLSFTGVGGETPGTFKPTAQFVVSVLFTGSGEISPPSAIRWAGLQGPLTLTAAGAFSAQRERLCKSEMTSDASVIGQAYRTHDCYVAISRNANSAGLDGFGGRIGGAKGSPDALPNSYNPFGRDPDTITKYGGRLNAGLKITFTGTANMEVITIGKGLACAYGALRVEYAEDYTPENPVVTLVQNDDLFDSAGKPVNCCCENVWLATCSNTWSSWLKGQTRRVNLYTVDPCFGLVPVTDECGYNITVPVENLFLSIPPDTWPWFVRWCMVYESCGAYYLMNIEC